MKLICPICKKKRVINNSCYKYRKSSKCKKCCHIGQQVSNTTRLKISKKLKGRRLSKKTKLNMRLNKQKEKNPAWKGGSYTNERGYILCLCKNHPFANNKGYVREHRLVMEKHLGRFLKPTEIVHHIDGDTSNNNISNLILCKSQKEHFKLQKNGGIL